MSKGTLNQVTLIGNLGKDPEFRQAASGLVGRLSIATTDSRKNKDGTWIDVTEWHNVTIFGKTAETMQKYLRKGSKVLVTGSLRNRKYESGGEVKYDYSVAVDSIQMLDRLESSDNEGSRSSGAARSLGGGSRSSGGSSASAASFAASQNAAPEFDDDIPF